MKIRCARKGISIVLATIFLVTLVPMTVTAVNLPPVADAEPNYQTVDVGDEAWFDGSSSYDPDGNITVYSWYFGDDFWGWGCYVTHVYTSPGLYYVMLMVIDDYNASDYDVVYVNVTAPNHPPIANDDYATVDEDSTNNQIDALANDYDSDNDTLTIIAVIQPSHGTASTDGSYVYYTPAENYNGNDSFTYTISDGNGGTDAATVTITVNPINDPPVANDDTATVNEDTTNNQINVLTNDNDIDGDTLIIISVTYPQHGTASTDGNYVYYTPDPNYYGPDSCDYTISDGHGGTDGATISLTVSQVNDPPNTPAVPTGPTVGKKGRLYTYTTSTTDPDGDQVYYMFSWGDNTYSSWLGPYPSGQIVSASHTWTKHGTYQVTVKAKDIQGAESGWSEPLQVKIR